MYQVLQVKLFTLILFLALLLAFKLALLAFGQFLAWFLLFGNLLVVAQ
jgi:hypothetical protein